MKLTNEQKNVIKGIIKSSEEQQITSLGGYAGTGKSTVVQHLFHLLKNWAVAAYTGKAAHVLRKKGLPASTIHSLIYVPQKDADGKLVLKNGSPVFVTNPELDVDGVLIDEASMVNKEIFEDLKSFGKPLIFVGDHGQLEPIGSDINLMQKPDFRLEQIHRNAGEIAYFANFIRQGYHPAAFTSQGGNKVEFIDKRNVVNYMAYVDQTICAFNKTRVELNRQLRYSKGLTDDWPTLGEKVMCLRNNRQHGLFNGMQGVVQYLYHNPKNKMIFEADGLKYDIFFDPSQFNREKYDFSLSREDPNPFDFCYAATCHKCQGSEFDKVLVLEQRSALWDSRRWLYTAASRAKNKLYWCS